MVKFDQRIAAKISIFKLVNLDYFLFKNVIKEYSLVTVNF